MALDQDRIRFGGKAIDAAMKYGGSLSVDPASAFFESLYSEWKASGSSLQESEAWLRQRLSGVFKSLENPPVWIEDEPSWPFLDGKPMVFLNQCSMPENALTARELSPGETVYLFGGRKTESGKTRMVYTTVSQYAEGW
jgi:hypothetical protein